MRKRVGTGHKLIPMLVQEALYRAIFPVPFIMLLLVCWFVSFLKQFLFVVLSLCRSQDNFWELALSCPGFRDQIRVIKHA